tara:strand:- start:894 stop:2048 length:1155 start_codon:yes stop_codon:yes gene_type:complete
MKILMIFSDMIRPNRLSVFNETISETPLDKSLINLGGTFYRNCFSEGPDTPRGLATFATGKTPFFNGCNTRGKWPRYFLHKNLKTIYDLFIEKNYELTFFSNPNERETGMFPEDICKRNIHNKDFNLKGYLNGIKLKQNHLLFISLPDFHWSFDDNGYTKYGEKKAFFDFQKSFDIIFNKFHKDEFDHIFVFSDHGYKFNFELTKEKKFLLLDQDRTNILMIHRQRNEDIIKFTDKLCGLSQIFHTVEKILNYKSSGLSLLSKKAKEYIIIEDHLDFAPVVNQNLGLWSIVKKEIIYIRTLENGYTIDRRSKKIVKKLNNEYDQILKNESSFLKYIEEYQKVSRYTEFIFKQTKYMHGGKRKKLSKILVWLFSLLDFINSKKRN